MKSAICDEIPKTNFLEQLDPTCKNFNFECYFLFNNTVFSHVFLKGVRYIVIAKFN